MQVSVAYYADTRRRIAWRIAVPLQPPATGKSGAVASADAAMAAVVLSNPKARRPVMKFYDCLTAPSPRRVRMFIAEKGVTLETKMVNLGAGEHLTEAFAKINPHRTVPVLELDDGTCLLDTFSICIYLEGIFAEPNLMGRDAKERAVISMWQRDMDLNGQNAIAECFRNSSRGLRGRAMTGPVDYEQIPELAERGRKRVRRFFRDLDRRFADSEYVAGDRFTIADITAFVAVDFARAIKETIPDDAVNLKRWREAVTSRPSSQV